MSNNNFRAAPVFLAFLCMGFGDVVGPLVGLAEVSFGVSNFSAQLLSFTGFIMFGLMSIPMGVYQDRKGKKHVLMLGLFVALVGLLIPIISGMYGLPQELTSNSGGKYIILLVAIFFLGAGATILQVAGNPIMRDISEEGKYSSNLSLAQGIKALGSSLGFLVPPAVAYLFNMDWTILFPIYSILIFITLIWSNFINIPEKIISERQTASFGSSIMLLKNPYVLMMVAGIFLYVGAEVSMSSQVPILMRKNFGIENFGLWVSWSLFFLPILLGRLVGSFVLRITSPTRFLNYSVMIALTGILFLLVGNKHLAFLGIVFVGLGFSNIFPLIFSITVDKYPERTNELSGLMITAISGGAVLPLLAGRLADISVSFGFFVPFGSILYLIFLAFNNKNKQT